MRECHDWSAVMRGRMRLGSECMDLRLISSLESARCHVSCEQGCGQRRMWLWSSVWLHIGQRS